VTAALAEKAEQGRRQLRIGVAQMAGLAVGKDKDRGSAGVRTTDTNVSTGDAALMHLLGLGDLMRPSYRTDLATDDGQSTLSGFEPTTQLQVAATLVTPGPGSHSASPRHALPRLPASPSHLRPPASPTNQLAARGGGAPAKRVQQAVQQEVGLDQDPFLGGFLEPPSPSESLSRVQSTPGMPGSRGTSSPGGSRARLGEGAVAPREASASRLQHTMHGGSSAPSGAHTPAAAPAAAAASADMALKVAQAGRLGLSRTGSPDGTQQHLMPSVSSSGPVGINSAFGSVYFYNTKRSVDMGSATGLLVMPASTSSHLGCHASSSTGGPSVEFPALPAAAAGSPGEPVSVSASPSPAAGNSPASGGTKKSGKSVKGMVKWIKKKLQ